MQYVWPTLEHLVVQKHKTHLKMIDISESKMEFFRLIFVWLAAPCGQLGLGSGQRCFEVKSKKVVGLWCV